ALLIGPAATAQTLSRSVAGGIGLSIALGLMVTWGGLAAAYYIGFPASTWIASLSFGFYLIGHAWRGGTAQG
ncbi:MAG: metal ABC transporter permease, partial [Rhodocyclales bacterium]|nr:metal ABC transporter permease [Rhodocyclales bacterium]